jgi:hypothetical protein
MTKSTSTFHNVRYKHGKVNFIADFCPTRVTSKSLPNNDLELRGTQLSELNILLVIGITQLQYCISVR